MDCGLSRKHLLLKASNEKLDLRIMSQFRYTLAKQRMRKKYSGALPRRSSDTESKSALPPIAHKKTASEVLSRTILSETRRLREVSSSYGRLLSSLHTSPLLSPTRSSIATQYSQRSCANLSLDLLREKLKSHRIS